MKPAHCLTQTLACLLSAPWLGPGPTPNSGCQLQLLQSQLSAETCPQNFNLATSIAIIKTNKVPVIKTDSSIPQGKSLPGVIFCQSVQSPDHPGPHSSDFPHFQPHSHPLSSEGPLKRGGGELVCKLTQPSSSATNQRGKPLNRWSWLHLPPRAIGVCLHLLNKETAFVTLHAPR